MAMEEYGLSPTLRSPELAALSTFAAFIVCGCVPLLSYLLSGGLYACVLATGATFFGVGAVRESVVPSGLVTIRITGFGDRNDRCRACIAVGYGLRLLIGT